MNVVLTIAVVGAGQLGSRHLQSIKQVNFPAALFVIDPNEASLKMAESRYDEVADNENIRSVVFATSINELPGEIDLVILATGSKNRALIIENICKHATVHNFVLEKILFQTIKEYGRINDLFKSEEINAWVNCPRRIFPVYQSLKQKLSDANEPVFGIMDGGDWGFGCNAIHYIDAFAFVVGCADYKLYTDQLDSQLVQSKREGYMEFHGSVTLHFANGCVLIVNSRKNEKTPASFLVSNGHARFLVDEARKKLYTSIQGDNSVLESSDFEIFFQSQLTRGIVEDILIRKQCGLTTYQESVQLHLPYIQGLIDFLKVHFDPAINHCPIT